MSKTSFPPTRRKFANEWDEIEYLYGKLLYWFYEQENPARARPYAARLERLLQKVPDSNEAILGQECRSLLYELKGDLPKAIEHRGQEIRLIEALLRMPLDPQSKKFVLHCYDYSDLSDRLDLLAILYQDSGDLEKAILTLQGSKQLCKREGITFDGGDLLQEYVAEKQGDNEAERDRQGEPEAPRAFHALWGRRSRHTAEPSRRTSKDRE
jgi:hypothetical protein